MIRPPPRSPLFPYTTLFRSSAGATQQVSGHRLGRAHRDFPCMLAKETLDGVRLKSFFGEHARKVAVSSTKSMTDRKSTRLNSSHGYISYAVFCLKKKIHDISAVVGLSPPKFLLLRSSDNHPVDAFSALCPSVLRRVSRHLLYSESFHHWFVGSCG